MTTNQPTRRRGWERRAAVWVVVCAVLGLVTTVGVAWWGALVPAKRVVIGRQSAANGGDLAVYFVRSSPMRVSRACLILADTEPLTGTTARWDPDDHYHGDEKWGRINQGAPPRVTAEQVSDLDKGAAVLLQEAASGWPMLALWASSDQRDSSYRAAGRTVLSDIIRSEVGGYAFPYRPMWPGFAVNAAVFGAAWFVLLGPVRAGLNTAQRSSRLRRGRCTACGYELKGIQGAVCPECGGKREGSRQ